MSVSPSNKIIKCKYCGLNAVVKYGRYKSNPLYWCKICKRKIKSDFAPYHSKVPIYIVSTAIALYYNGRNFNYIQNQLKQKYSYYPSRSLLFKWLGKYTKAAKQLFSKYHPKVGNTWIVDETMFTIAGEEKRRIDIIDSETRYLLITKLLPYENKSDDVQNLIHEASLVARKKPGSVVTYLMPVLPGLDATPRAIDLKAKLAQRRSRPYKIERWRNTVLGSSETRHFKKLSTTQKAEEEFMLYYNYLLPNDAIGDKTPAEAAGIDYQCKTWEDIIKQTADLKLKSLR